MRSYLGEFTLVLEQRQQSLTDFLGLTSAQTTHSIDGFHTNQSWVLFLYDNLVQIFDSVVQSGVTDGLQDKDLLVDGFSLLPLIDQNLLVLVFLSTRAQFLNAEQLLLGLSGLLNQILMI